MAKKDDIPVSSYEPKQGVMKTSVYKTPEGKYRFEVEVTKGKQSFKSQDYDSRTACLFASIVQSVNVYETSVL